MGCPLAPSARFGLVIAALAALSTLAAVGCATPKTVVEVPPCADRVDISGQAQRLAPRRFELDHTFDLVFTKSELTFKGRGEPQTLTLENDRPDPVRAVVGAGLTVAGVLLAGTAWWDVTAGGRDPFEERPFYEALWGAGMIGVGALALSTGWHPDRSYVEWEGACPAGDAAPGLAVETR